MPLALLPAVLLSLASLSLTRQLILRLLRVFPESPLSSAIVYAYIILSSNSSTHRGENRRRRCRRRRRRRRRKGNNFGFKSQTSEARELFYRSLLKHFNQI